MKMIKAAFRPVAGTACASTIGPDLHGQQPAKERRDVFRHQHINTQITCWRSNDKLKHNLHFLHRFHSPEPATATGAMRGQTLCLE